MCAQVSQEQFDKIMALIQSGIEQGAKLEVGGKRYGAPACLKALPSCLPSCRLPN